MMAKSARLNAVNDFDASWKGRWGKKPIPVSPYARVHRLNTNINLVAVQATGADSVAGPVIPNSENVCAPR